MEYLWLKLIHIASAFLLIGTGFGSAFYKFFTDRTKSVPAIVVVNRYVVLADWMFTTPTIIIQLVTGIWLASILHIPMTTGWFVWVLGLYLLMGACWIPVVFLQIKMQHMAEAAHLNGDTELPATYYRLALIWTILGIPAFIAAIMIIWLMVFRAWLM
ncbi:DUF2269 domain-containing protein [Candidatus Albibeggiatoa sp. nov. BB20]|uniref:DUF2269 family protein n=1 Tax=Candidatus Albibeggiatoa sp. nov. BB20 TaxID=3162723 RepID=UPI0033655BDD